MESTKFYNIYIYIYIYKALCSNNALFDKGK